MQMSSVWIIAMVLGGALVVVANLQYSVAKEREERIELAQEAKSLLIPELKKNAEHRIEILNAINSRTIPFFTFQVVAWDTVSRGGLLRGLDVSEVSKFLHVYQQLNTANDLQLRLLEMVTGVSSAITGTAENKEKVMSNLKIVLANLDAPLKELTE